MGFISSITFTVLLVIFVSGFVPMFSNFFRGYLSAEKSQSPARSRQAGGEDVQIIEPPTEDGDGQDLNAESTPKARASQPGTEVPSLALESEDEPTNQLPVADQSSARSLIDQKRNERMMLPPPTQPAQKFPSTGSSSSLMPPPSRPINLSNRNSPASLRVPSTGPLPNRGIPANSQQRVSSVSSTNSRGKVLLSPGHSPMDWAALTRKTNLGGVETFQRVTPSELRKMTGRKGKPAWSSWQNKVYNITPYLPFHPGGEAELMKAAGRDGTQLFLDIHPWVNWDNMLQSCLVGVMVPEDFDKGDGGSLEDMD